MTPSRPADGPDRPRPAPQACRRRWRWVGVLAVLALAAVHRPILRAAAAALILEQSFERADFVLPAEGQACFHQAAGWLRRGAAQRVLLLDRYHERAVRLGVLPSRVQSARSQLAQEGVGEEAIAVVPGQPRTWWQWAAALAPWLREHPDARVTILCQRLQGRDLRLILDRTLPAEASARVRVFGLRDEMLPEDRWWLDRNGLKLVFTAWLRLAYDACRGPGPEDAPEWDPDQFEQSLR